MVSTGARQHTTKSGNRIIVRKGESIQKARSRYR